MSDNQTTGCASLIASLLEAAEQVVTDAKQTDAIPNEWGYGPVIIVEPSAWFRLQRLVEQSREVPAPDLACSPTASGGSGVGNEPGAGAEILDACCGGRMWWWDKQHPLAVYMDNRVAPPGSRSTRPNWECKPDVIGDFRAMPFLRSIR